MRLDVAIIDDEPDSRSVLKKLLIQFCPQVNIVGEASDIESAHALIVSTNPQAVFLDIQMPGGNGFQLLKKFENIPFEVIFVTSYDKYAIDAIKLNALHYLMKPVEVQDLTEAVDRLEKNLDRKKTQQLQFVNLIAQLEDKSIERKVVVHNNDAVMLLSLSEISHMEGESNYTVIYTINGRKFTASKNLGEFEDLLEDYRQFIRIGKSYIINLNHLTGYSKGEPCIVNLTGGFSCEVTRRKKQEVLERLKKNDAQQNS